MSDSHAAKDSLLGYLYQCRFALLQSLKEAKVHAANSVSIERFDDVAFEKGDIPLELVQTKHHGKPAETGDNSVDVWKTLNIWSQRAALDPSAVSETRFVLVTTATAVSGSALSALRTSEDRKPTEALALLEKAAKTSRNKTTQKGRDAFLNLDAPTRKLLVHNIWVFDQSPKIEDTRAQIEDILFYAAPSDQVKNFVNYVEGWWFSRVIAALSGSSSEAIPLNTIEQKITEIRESFQSGNLPLDEAIDAMPPAPNLPGDGRTFVRQMRFVDASERHVASAAHDFYRAFEQRSRWVRESLLLDGEADRYDRALLDAWQRKFITTCDDSREGCGETKKRAGRDLLNWACSHPKPFRNRDELWLSAGSFHMLADGERLGWHPEYTSLLIDKGDAK